MPVAPITAAVDCSLPNVTNAVSTTANSGTTYLLVANVTCQTGYTSNGATGIITCGSNETWTGFTCDGTLWLQAAICLIRDVVIL